MIQECRVDIYFFNLHAACNITACPVASEFSKKWQSSKQNKTLTCPAQQVMFLVESLQCNSPLFNRVVGQVDVPAEPIDFRGSLPCSASNVLEPMLHPDMFLIEYR